jgi:hypothetical protein
MREDPKRGRLDLPVDEAQEEKLKLEVKRTWTVRQTETDKRGTDLTRDLCATFGLGQKCRY